jgi:hypothetical protein
MRDIEKLPAIEWMMVYILAKEQGLRALMKENR